METNALFTMALGLTSPWTVQELQFDAAKRQLEIRVDFQPGSTFPCPECGAASKVHDAPEHAWRHLSFFEHKTYVKARQPRVKCEVHGVRQAAVPWARSGAGFTLLFEAFAIELVRGGMPVAAAARIVGIHDTRLWRMLDHQVGAALGRQDLSEVTKVGVDETSRAKGHHYLSLFVNLPKKKVIFIARDRDHTTVKQFRERLLERGGKPESVTDFSLDMSPAFTKGIREAFPNAHLTFDKFHVIALASRAIDQVRREEQKTRPELKQTRWLWQHNEGNLTEGQRLRFEAVRDVATRTARAYRYREMLQDLYRQADRATAETFLQRWLRSASRCRLAPVRKVAATVKDHLEGVLRWFDSRVTNGLLEGLNSLIQSTKRAARGFRNLDYMATLIYLRLGDLEIKLPQVLPG